MTVERKDRYILLLLFVGISSIYFSTCSGITCSNDGSHYALVRAMADNHTFELGSFAAFTQDNDVAKVEGRTYSDRPPGTAMVGVIFYKTGALLPPPIQSLPSHHDARNPRLLYLLLLPVFAGTGTVLLLYFLTRRFGISPAGAFTACVMFALGTIHWKYSTVLFSHAFSSLCVAGIVTLAFILRRGDRSPSRLSACLACWQDSLSWWNTPIFSW